MPKKKTEMNEEIIIDAFKEGDYPQGKFGAKELAEIQETYNPKNYEAPILIGHLSDPSYKGKSAIPAFGWIGKVKVVGDHLKLVASQFSEELKEFIKKGFYKKLSVAFYEPTDATNPTPGKWHLHHLAFLGGTPPAVKGLEGIQFAEYNLKGVAIEMAEMNTEVSIDGEAIDAVESVCIEDTVADITECCAHCMMKIEECLKADIDIDTCKQRCNLAIYDMQTECQKILDMHFACMNKMENIEGGEGTEMSEKKSVILKFKELFTKRKELAVDTKKEQEYQERIATLQAKITTFEEEKKAAEEARVAAEARAAEEAVKAEIKTFCDAAVKDNKMTPAMREKDEPIMFVLAQTNKDALKSFQEKYITPVVPLGEVKEVNVTQNTDHRPQVFVSAEKYVNDHPNEFADIPDASMKINRAIYRHSMGQIKFEDDNKFQKGAK